MNHEDDLIGRALGAETSAQPASERVLTLAFEAGAARRRRRTWAAGGLATAVVLVGGMLVAAGSGDDGAVIGVDPSIVDDTAVPTTTGPIAATTSAPTGDDEPVADESSPSSSITPRETTSTRVTTSTAPATSTIPLASPSSVPTTIVPISDPPHPCDAAAGGQMVDLDSSGAPPLGEAFRVIRVDGDEPVTELWTPDRRWAALTLRHDMSPNCVESATATSYDGRWLWIVITGDPGCQCADWETIVVRADLSRGGEMLAMWSTTWGTRVRDVQPDDAGGALILTVQDDSAYELHRVGAAAGNAQLLDGWSRDQLSFEPAEISPDGTFVAFVSNGSPMQGHPLLALERVGSADGPQTIDLTGKVWTGLGLDWSADGRRLMVYDDSDEYFVARIDVSVTNPHETIEQLGTDGCETDDGSTYFGSWPPPAVDGDPLVTSELRRGLGADQSVIGTMYVSQRLACLAGGGVVWEQLDNDGSPSYWSYDPGTGVAAVDLGATSELGVQVYLLGL